MRSIGLLPPKPAPPTHLSDVQRQRLQQLWARLGVLFDPAQAAHAASLRDLYALGFPNLPPLLEVRLPETPNPTRPGLDAKGANRPVRVWHGATENGPWNGGYIANTRGVRTHVSKGYTRVEGKSAGDAKQPSGC